MTGTSARTARLARGGTLLWGGARTALGVVALSHPPLVGRPWIGSDADTTGGRVFARALGVRDVALGAGTMAAAARGRGAGTWVVAGAAADVGDALITVVHRHSLPRGRRAFITAVAAGSAAAGFALALAGRRG